MATLYISEYGYMGKSGDGKDLPIVFEPPIAEQTVTFTTSTQSSAFNSATKFIRVHTDAICSILIGSNPTATTSKKRLPADHTEYFGVNPGDKIAAVTNT